MRVFAATLLAVLLVALLVWRPWNVIPPDESQPPPSAGSNPLSAPQPNPVTPEPQPEPRPATVPVVEPKGLTPEEIQAVRDAIDNLEFVFRDYATVLGGNPVGTNAEITAALRGDNLKQLKLDLPGGSTVNPAGELCDPWGTPWFFHQLSRLKMEVRSAGKDRQLYTDDDFVR